MAATRSSYPAFGSGSDRSLGARLVASAMAVWGAFVGVLPHVLHHAGPLAGAAFVAGATGKLLFGVIGLVASIPLLRRLYRRFHTWVAPAAALAVFASAFALSTFVIGPAISGNDQQAKPGIQQPSNHSSHHP